MPESVVQEQLLLEKIRALPPEKRNEVEDFVDFLRQRDDDAQLVRAASHLSESSLRKIWDNSEDDVYNSL